MGWGKSRDTISQHEVALLINIVAGLKPEDYIHDSAKSLIYKCRDLIDRAAYVRYV